MNTDLKEMIFVFLALIGGLCLFGFFILIGGAAVCGF